jgi:glycosyl transferase family 87
MKCTLLCGFLVLLAVSECLLFVSASTKSRTPGSDFAILYAGARLVNENPLDLYNAQAQFKIEREVLHSENWAARFLYPPFFALAISSLGRMNYVAAYWAWTGFTALLYLASVLLLIREFPGNTAIFALAAIGCPAFHWLILAGQTTVIALFIFVLIYIALRRRLYFIAGAFIALLGYRPQFMILIAPICLMKLPRSAFFGFVAMLFALFVAGVVGLSLDSYARYLALIREMTDLLRLAIHPLGFFVSAYGLLRMLGSETLATVASVGLAILSGYWLFVQWPSERDVGGFASWFASLIVATLLTMSYSLIYDLLLIMVVIALAPWSVLRSAQASALAFLYCAPVFYLFLGSGAINLSPIALGWLFITINRMRPSSYGGIQAEAHRPTGSS